MKNIKLSVCCAAVALASLALPGAAIAGPEAALSQVSLNADYMSQNYHETDNPLSSGLTAWDRELGTIPGGSVEVGWLAPYSSGLSNLYLGGFFQYNNGNVNYHGTSLDGTELINDTTKTRIEDGDFEIGKGFYVVTPKLMLVPVFFYGERDWDRDLVGDVEEEDYRTAMAGAAVHVAYALTGRITLIGRFGVAKMMSPSMKLTSDGANLKFYQGSEIVGQAEAGLDVLLASHWHVRGTVDYNGFTYGQSTQDDGYLEPSSATTDISVKVGVGYDFE